MYFHFSPHATLASSSPAAASARPTVYIAAYATSGVVTKATKAAYPTLNQRLVGYAEIGPGR